MSAKAQIKKEQVIRELQETRQSILAEIDVLSAKDRNMVFLGIWSVRDLLAHLAGWDFTNVEAIKSVLAGKLPAFYEHRDRDWQTYNAMLVRKYKTNSFRELRATVKKSQKKLVAYVQSIPPEDFNRDFGVRFRGYKVTIQRLLEADIKDVLIHRQQTVDFFREGRRKQ